MKKTVLIVLSLLFVLSVLPVGLCAAQKPAGTYVVDPDDVISAETEDAINGKCGELFRKNGSEVYVYCASSAEAAKDLAQRLFDDWELSSRSAIFVISPAAKDYYALAGGDLSGALSSETIKNVLADTVEPAFAEGNYGEAASGFAGAVTEKISVLDFSDAETDSGSAFSRVLVYLILILLILAAVAVVIVFIIRTVRANRMKKSRFRRRFSSK